MKSNHRSTAPVDPVVYARQGGGFMGVKPPAGGLASGVIRRQPLAKGKGAFARRDLKEAEGTTATRRVLICYPSVPRWLHQGLSHRVQIAQNGNVIS